ncbi:hypothetical protein [Gordonia alkanivorans]|uniref:hypothetical protein n=1 Tax=Gordonia alkanivorans TaxID=84096 RepID=UPI002449CAC6|nr:hypothetical protein [Gordonia alkanivorans]MDH3013895.1 hypothetical protein [Gordonia alkanivorans]
MSDHDGGGMANRVTPKRARVGLTDLTLIVRPHGDPAAVRAFTADELAEAEAYAKETGGQVDSLP